MKFSEIKQEDWAQLHPYLDTCVLPITGLRGDEQPWEVTEQLIRLRDLLDGVEIPYKGRIVTYPAIQYEPDEDSNTIDQICSKLKEGGFRFVVIVTVSEKLAGQAYKHADLILGPVHNDTFKRIEQLWV